MPRGKKICEGVTKFSIGIITDLDKASKDVDEEGETVWKALVMRGELTYNESNKNVSVKMQGKECAKTVISEYSRGGRGMELSELIMYNGLLLSVDDRTGIVFEVGEEADESVESKAIPKVILADGNGKQPKGFKGEWMTIKDELLYVGGHGREFVSLDGKSIIHENWKWVKIISKEGAVKHEFWGTQYDAIRNAAGCPYPGYLIHESCVWSQIHKKWFFLPRKVSKEGYDPVLDEQRAGNILISCSENFKNIEIVTVGTLTHKTRGFSSFKFIPGTDDSVIIAVKSEEVGKVQESYLTAFNTDGKVIMDDVKVGDLKFEGIEFI